RGSALGGSARGWPPRGADLAAGVAGRDAALGAGAARLWPDLPDARAARRPVRVVPPTPAPRAADAARPAPAPPPSNTTFSWLGSTRMPRALMVFWMVSPVSLVAGMHP